MTTKFSGREYLDRARTLAPMIQACADDIERDRRLPRSLLTALIEAGMFRLLLPRSLGGGEVDPITFVEVMEEIAKVDASTAWCLCQAAGCSMTAAYLPPAVAQKIFGRDQEGIVAWGPGPDARAVAADGGYRVTGTWSFASGSRHATWLGAHCPVYETDGTLRKRPDGATEVRTMLFPASQATLIDVWHVMGLRGTGSDSFSVSDLFVPRDYSVLRDDPSERREEGALYCFKSGNLYASGYAGLALGVARSTLEALIDLAKEKKPRGFARLLRDNAVVQFQVGQAEAKLRSARAFLMTSLDEIWDAIGRSGNPTLTLDQRVTIRLAATHAIHQAREIVEVAYNAAGGNAVFTNNAFERRFRDIHTVTQQLQGRWTHFETVGQFLLGLEPDTTWM